MFFLECWLKNFLSLQRLLHEKAEIFVTDAGLVPKFIIKQTSNWHNALSPGATEPSTEYLSNITHNVTTYRSWYNYFITCVVIITYTWIMHIIITINLYSNMLMKQQFIITHWCKILQETKERKEKKKTCQILDTPTLKHGTFLWKYMDKQFLFL